MYCVHCNTVSLYGVLRMQHTRDKRTSRVLVKMPCLINMNSRLRRTNTMRKKSIVSRIKKLKRRRKSFVTSFVISALMRITLVCNAIHLERKNC